MSAIPEMHDWQKADPDVFWGEIAPCDHLLQITNLLQRARKRNRKVRPFGEMVCGARDSAAPPAVTWSGVAANRGLLLPYSFANGARALQPFSDYVARDLLLHPDHL